MSNKQKAAELLTQFKGKNYIHGINCFNQLGAMAASYGKRASLVVDGIGQSWADPIHAEAKASLAAAGVELAGDMIPGSGPNAPREDVFRIAEELGKQNPDVVISIGGGSGIDATKCAVAHMTLQGDLDTYFGVGQVAAQLEASGKKMIPHIACMLAASSAAHLTKYSNITNLQTGQKMLIVDDAVVPPKAMFDYRFTQSQPVGLTMDGALDGISHCLEVFMGLSGEKLDQARPVCLLGIEMVVKNVKKAVQNPTDLGVREELGLATDLGGYAIMIGGTNGAHLNSFSLVDILSHGRACALMNPYYVVFFAPAIEGKLREVGALYKAAGYTNANLDALSGRELGLAVAEAMVALSKDIGFPTKLTDVKGFSDEHITRCLTAAKNPALDSKLKNMPVQLSAATVDEYMGSVLQAAKAGDFSLIKSM